MSGLAAHQCAQAPDYVAAILVNDLVTKPKPAIARLVPRPMQNGEQIVLRRVECARRG
jgi:hypothetical protein